FQDENFTARVSVAPVLTEGPFRDAPAPRADDWSGQVRGPHHDLRAVVDGELPNGVDDGGLQMQRHPALGEADSTRTLDWAFESHAEQGDDSDAQSIAMT